MFRAGQFFFLSASHMRCTKVLRAAAGFGKQSPNWTLDCLVASFDFAQDAPRNDSYLSVSKYAIKSSACCGVNVLEKSWVIPLVPSFSR
jgi:hypothetical protein